jgi:hypothetical protein
MGRIARNIYREFLAPICRAVFSFNGLWVAVVLGMMAFVPYAAISSRRDHEQYWARKHAAFERVTGKKISPQDFAILNEQIVIQVGREDAHEQQVLP